MIYHGSKPCTLVHGNYKPAELYHGSTKIAGYTEREVTGDGAVVLDGTYNDPAALTIAGNSVQDGTPTPNSPVEIENCGDNGISLEVRGKNLFDTSAALEDLSDCKMWGKIVYTKTQLKNMLKPNTIYHASFDVECLEDTEYTKISDNRIGFLLINQATGYSDGNVGYSNIAPILYKKGYKLHLSNNFMVSKLSSEIMQGYTQKIVKPDGTNANIRCRFSNFQIELGNKETSYQHYYPPQQISIPHSITLANGTFLDMARVGDCADEIVIGNGTVKFIKRVEKIVLDGMESVMINSNDCAHPFAYIQALKPALSLDIGFCSHGAYKRTDCSSAMLCAGVFASGIMRMRFGHETSAEDFKNFLEAQYAAGTPVTVYYALAEPVITDITDTEIGQQLIALRTFPMGTSVIQTDDGLPATLTLKAKVSDASVLSNITLSETTTTNELSDFTPNAEISNREIITNETNDI